MLETKLSINLETAAECKEDTKSDRQPESNLYFLP